MKTEAHRPEPPAPTSAIIRPATEEEMRTLPDEWERASPRPTIDGIAITGRDGNRMVVPMSDFDNLDQGNTCEHCGTKFQPRKGSGGKPQRFCSKECRTAWHADAQRGQRSPTCEPETLPAVTAPQPPDDGEFSWSEADVVVPSQPAIAVYFNPRGEVVIRQESQMHPDEDHFVFINMKNLMPLIDKLCDLAGIPSAGGQ